MSRYVFLHGFTGGPAFWDRLRSSLPEAEALAPALAGHDGRVATASSFEGEVDRIAAQVRSEGFEGAHLVGYSLGARVALGLSARHPSLFARATLIGVHPGLEDEGERAARRADDARWIDLLEKESLEAFVDRWQALPLWSTQSNLSEDLLTAQRRARLGQDPRSLASSLRILGLAEMPSYRSRLNDLALPVTLVAGSLDRKFVALAQEMLPSLKNGRLAIVEGAGHNVVLEASERLAEILEEPR